MRIQVTDFQNDPQFLAILVRWIGTFFDSENRTSMFGEFFHHIVINFDECNFLTMQIKEKPPRTRSAAARVGRR